MSNDTVPGIVIDSTTETPKKKFRRPSKKTLIAIGVTATTIAAAATVVIKSNSKDDENADLSALEFDSSTTETLADLENPIQS
ncbi:MAG: hypothetical protein IPM04_13295 [Saprospiraceae bacterium]|nr:hypothetical protein [Candidatus Brachybacter algidus]MBK8748793.1 hypothetical protein [Candidatus Brachybacter algidus]